MRIASTTLAALAVTLGTACSSLPSKIEPWSTTEGMNAPESAYVADGVLYVSQVGMRQGGTPNDKDGNGRISKLALDGKVIAANWVTGLNSPKGIRSHGGTLWVSDIDEVVGIDIARGAIVSRVKIDGAKFLNDVACGPDGTVYVSDMLASRIWQIKDGKPSVFAEGEQIEYPNGLLYENGALVVGGWGKPEADFSTKTPGRLFKLDIVTKSKTLITPTPTGNIDGVESDGRGGYVITDWIAGRVIHVSPTGSTRTLRQFKSGTADHAYLPGSNTLIVPQMMENRVFADDLGKDMAR